MFVYFILGKNITLAIAFMSKDVLISVIMYSMVLVTNISNPVNYSNAEHKIDNFCNLSGTHTFR